MQGVQLWGGAIEGGADMGECIGKGCKCGELHRKGGVLYGVQVWGVQMFGGLWQGAAMRGWVYMGCIAMGGGSRCRGEVGVYGSAG